MASGEDTLRDVFDNAGLEMGNGTLSVDGASVEVNQIDRPISELGLNEEIVHSMTSVAKLNCAYNVFLAGGAAIVVSKFSPDDLATTAKYKPKLLQLKDDDGDIRFSVSAVKGTTGSLNKFGAAFSSAKNSEGRATITIPLEDGKNTKEWFVDNYANALFMLGEVEAQVEESLGAVYEAKETLASSITQM
jgi:hypothetical protein